MSMFCYQCQETVSNTGCTRIGVCGKKEDVAKIQDLMIHTIKGISLYSRELNKLGKRSLEVDHYILYGLFATITNANFDKEVFIEKIRQGLKMRENLKQQLAQEAPEVKVPELDEAVWFADTIEEMESKAETVGVLAEKNEDIRSLKEMITYGLKGMSAYTHHANNLAFEDPAVHDFIQDTLAKLTDDSLTADDLVALTLETGSMGVQAMKLLDDANTGSYGHPEMTKVNIGVRNNPGILISGHDLKDLEELLVQSKDSGVDVYTHSEMLPANSYPAFKKYNHFVGNYGGSWWHQNVEFEKFNGPVLLTSNCLVPPRDSYKDKIYNTNAVGFPGCQFIPDRVNGQPKDFSAIIEHAKKCDPPEALESGEIYGGFAHNQVISLADKVIEAVKSGTIKRFFVMGGCDARQNERSYYTDFAKALPEDTVILTAGCAKYRYNKLDLGDIGGIPRVLDAGQCNDSYSLVQIALALKDAFELEDVNDLPISYNIAWYEQKAVLVLLALLSLGIKNIHIGPTLPGFLSPNVAQVIVDKFDLAPIGTVEEDLKAFMQ